MRRAGPPDGPPLLLVHGATVPSWELDALAPCLAEAGYRVVRFDLYGHGRSERPRRRYGLDLFVAQARELIAHLGLDPRRTGLVGHSMGAAIAAAVAAEAGARALVLLAPMLDFHAVNRGARLLRAPVLGELLMAAYGRRALIRRRRRRYHAIGRPEMAAWFREQTRQPGYWRALLSMMRHGALGDQMSRYRSAAAAGHEPLILHGSADAIVPPAHVDAIAAAFPRHRREVLEELGHNFILTHPRRVADSIDRHVAGVAAAPQEHPAR